MSSMKQDPQEPSTTVARSSRGKGRWSWRTFALVLAAVASFSNSRAYDEVFGPVSGSSQTTCVVEQSFDVDGVERRRKEVCRTVD